MIWRLRDQLVPAAGLLVLVSSVLPWWVLRVRVGSDNGAHYETHYGTAWRMSSRWSTAVLLAAGAAAIWVLWRLVRGRVPLPVLLALLAAGGFALYLTVAQLLDVKDFTSGVTREVVTIAPVSKPTTDPFVAGWMERDHLRSYHHSPYLYAGFSDGCWIGLAAMVLVVVALILTGSGGVRRPTAD
jgi:hypothetical protein